LQVGSVPLDVGFTGVSLVEQAIPEAESPPHCAPNTHLVIAGDKDGPASIGGYAAVLGASVDAWPDVMCSLFGLDAVIDQDLSVSLAERGEHEVIKPAIAAAPRRRRSLRHAETIPFQVNG